MNAMYQEGREARKRGKKPRFCPYGTQVRSVETDTGYSRGVSELAKRHWWLAGWHDKDMEMGVSVMEGVA